MSASRVDPSSDKFERAKVVQAPVRNPNQRLKEEHSNISLTLGFLDENEAWSEEILPLVKS